MLDLTLNSTYNLITLAPSVLGGEYRNQKLITIYASEKAPGNVQDIHANILPLLPTGTPSYITDLVFYEFLDTTNGNINIFADYWLDPEHVELTGTASFLIKVYNVPESSSTTIRDLLVGGGYTNIDIENL